MDELLVRETPQLTVVSGPMGGGKSGANSVVIGGLAQADLRAWSMERDFLISDTSRGRREEMGEAEDAYNFNQPPEKFEEAVRTGDLMEMTNHSGDYYGSPTPPEGRPVHLEIEVSGVRQILDSQHPRVVAARLGMRSIYLLQDSMGALAHQIINRPDEMPLEKKMKRIARYPAEVMYILERELPYGFILNPNGRPGFMKDQVLKYMLKDPDTITQGRRLAEQKAQEALRWLAQMGIEPEPVIDPEI